MRRKAENIEIDSGNVFVDPGFGDASERKLRVQRLMRSRGLTQAAAAKISGIPPPHIPEPANFKPSRFSSERLMRFLTLLDVDVEIVIHPKAQGHAVGRISVSSA
jgi:predicted XRE-type DNA-binding protein